MIYSPASYLAETIPSYVRLRIAYPFMHMTCASHPACSTSRISAFRNVSGGAEMSSFSHEVLLREKKSP